MAAFSRKCMCMQCQHDGELGSPVGNPKTPDSFRISPNSRDRGLAKVLKRPLTQNDRKHGQIYCFEVSGREKSVKYGYSADGVPNRIKNACRKDSVTPGRGYQSIRMYSSHKVEQVLLSFTLHHIDKRIGACTEYRMLPLEVSIALLEELVRCFCQSGKYDESLNGQGRPSDSWFNKIREFERRIGTSNPMSHEELFVPVYFKKTGEYLETASLQSRSSTKFRSPEKSLLRRSASTGSTPTSGGVEKSCDVSMRQPPASERRSQPRNGSTADTIRSRMLRSGTVRPEHNGSLLSTESASPGSEMSRQSWHGTDKSEDTDFKVYEDRHGTTVARTVDEDSRVTGDLQVESHDATKHGKATASSFAESILTAQTRTRNTQRSASEEITESVCALRQAIESLNLSSVVEKTHTAQDILSPATVAASTLLPRGSSLLPDPFLERPETLQKSHQEKPDSATECDFSSKLTTGVRDDLIGKTVSGPESHERGVIKVLEEGNSSVFDTNMVCYRSDIRNASEMTSGHATLGISPTLEARPQFGRRTSPARCKDTSTRDLKTPVSRLKLQHTRMAKLRLPLDTSGPKVSHVTNGNELAKYGPCQERKSSTTVASTELGVAPRRLAATASPPTKYPSSQVREDLKSYLVSTKPRWESLLR